MTTKAETGAQPEAAGKTGACTDVASADRPVALADCAALLLGIGGLALLGFHACGVEPPALWRWLFDTSTGAAAYFVRGLQWGSTRWELWTTSGFLSLVVYALSGTAVDTWRVQARNAVIGFAIIAVHALVGCGVIKGATLAALGPLAQLGLYCMCALCWSLVCLWWLVRTEPKAGVSR